MPGMNSGLSPADPTLVAAFRSALLHQGLIALLIIAFLGLLWATARVWRPATAGALRRSEPGEPRGRMTLRVGFGLIWVLDGILQAQPKMAGGLASQVIEPAASASPSWVQHLVNWGGTIWSYHPITAGAASVWIQVGIGVLAAGRGARHVVQARGAGRRGLGARGVGVRGVVRRNLRAGPELADRGARGRGHLRCRRGLVALPEDAWRGPRLGRLLLAGTGTFFLGMAVLQAWPGRGFWSGTGHGQPGPLAGMVQQMAGTSQPHFLSALVAGFGSFAASNGFAVNLVVVIALAAMGAIFLTGRPRLVRYAVWFGLAFCLADWLLVQDLGFLGGVGTDPNSMIPWILLIFAGYLALTPAPAPAVEEAAVGAGAARTESAAARGWRERLRPLAPRAAGTAIGSASARSAAAVAALGIVLVGAAPMAAAAANRTADPILALAIAGNSAPMDFPAPGFQLTDQNGQPVSLADLHGKVVLMTFLDPVCTTDCPIIGAEMKETGALLGPADKDVELVAVVANPTYRSAAFTQAFDREEGLNTVPNWLYLTGSLSQLSRVWQQYGIAVQNLPAGAMSAHNDLAVVIDRTGHIRDEVGADPGPGTASTQSSFSVLLSQYARQALASS